MKQAVLILATVGLALFFKKDCSTENILFVKDAHEAAAADSVMAIRQYAGMTESHRKDAMNENVGNRHAVTSDRACTLMSCYY